MKNIIIVSQFSALFSIACFCGVMLCIYTSHLSYWKQIPAESFLDWFSSYSGGISNATGPLGILSMLLPFVVLIVTWGNSNSRAYWLYSFLLALAVIAITMLYFVKTNTSFIEKTIPLNAVPNTLITWGKVHLIRIVLTSISAISAVIGIIKYQN